MKTKGLQIGNLIQDKYGNIEIVNQLLTIGDYIDRVNDEPYEDYYSPIPLSEEWLLKMGFEQPGHGFNELQLDYNDGEIIIDINDRIYIGTNEFYVKDVPLHRLQNIFHSLTGEELTIKE